MNRDRHLSLKAALFVSVALWAVPSFAADDPATPKSGATPDGPTNPDGNTAAGPEVAAADNAITVTATRVGNPNFTAPTTTEVMTAQNLETRAADSIADSLVQLPAFRATTNPQSNGVRAITPGASFGDLRGLGESRTLVLVDGNRYVPQIYTGLGGYQVDLNQIPPLLVERAEVVTGGASAQWGSDAVAGVVNIILKKNFQGFDFDAEGGISDHGDNKSYRLSMLAGTDFADGKGNIEVAVDRWENGGVGDVFTRDWGRQGWQIAGNPAGPANGAPKNIIAPDVRFSGIAPGGLIVGARMPNGTLIPLNKGTTFDSNGNPIPFIYGQYPGSGTNGVMIGGGSNAGLNVNTGLTIRPKGKRTDFFGRLSYEFAPAFDFYLEGNYVETYGSNETLPARDGAIKIYADNPYLPASLRQSLIDSGASYYEMGRANYDLQQQVSDTRNDTYRIVGGFTGDLSPDWHWDGAVIYGRNDYNQKVYHNRNRTNFDLAADPVWNASHTQAVCRVNADADPNNDAPGCVPMDLFGSGSISQAAADYVTGTTVTETVYDQFDANLNLHGTPFSTWAGAVSVAVGAEYRSESQRTTVDPVAATANWESSNAYPLDGKFNVKEAYAEAVVPLAKDAPFAESLDLNGAVRVADYSTSAGTQVTWKVGLTWRPTNWLLLRGARSRDIRAPNIYELNALGNVTRVNVLYDGNPYQVEQHTGGNPDLQPEKSDTWTAGMVLQPAILPGLDLSLDYYNIAVHGAIATTAANQIFDFCAQGQQYYCDFITFVGNVPTVVNNPYFNLDVLEREGIDGEVAYRTHVGSGDLGISLRANYTFKNGTDAAGDATPFRNVAGSIQGVPKFTGTANLNYEINRFKFNTQVRYLSSMLYNIDYVEGVDINDNTVPSVAYVDLGASYKITKNVEIFGNVDNVLDKDPPIAPSTFGYPTQPQFYDMIGRTYRAGVRGRF